MATITVALEEQTKRRMEQFLWVNWSEVGREEALRKYLFDQYVKTGKLSKEELAFCERIDWHPVDDLPFKKEFLERVKRAKKEKAIPLDAELFD